MSKLFYDHLVNIEEIIIVLSEYDISEDDRQQILSTIDETIHQGMKALGFDLNKQNIEDRTQYQDAFMFLMASSIES